MHIFRQKRQCNLCRNLHFLPFIMSYLNSLKVLFVVSELFSIDVNEKCSFEDFWGINLLVFQPGVRSNRTRCKANIKNVTTTTTYQHNPASRKRLPWYHFPPFSTIRNHWSWFSSLLTDCSITSSLAAKQRFRVMLFYLKHTYTAFQYVCEYRNCRQCPMS